MISTFTRTQSPNFGVRKLPELDKTTLIGKFASEVFAIPRIKASDEVEIVRKLRRGDSAAKQSIVNNVLRFVLYNIDNQVGLSHPSAMDLVQDVYLTLRDVINRAASRKKGPKRLLTAFNSRARQAVIDALSNDVEIKVKVKCPQHDWPGRLKGQDDIPFPEIASRRVLRRIRKTPMNQHLSLSMPVGRGKTLADVLTDDTTGNPLLAAEKSEMSKCVTQRLANINPRRKHVLGLHYWQGLTLDEVGAANEITREAARQIEVKGLNQLGRGPHRNILLEHYEG